MKNVVFGIVIIILGIWGLMVWWEYFRALLRGLVPILLIILGMVAVGAGLHPDIEEIDNEKDNSSN